MIRLVVLRDAGAHAWDRAPREQARVSFSIVNFFAVAVGIELDLVRAATAGVRTGSFLGGSNAS